MKVLIVDHDARRRGDSARVLQEAGHTVTEAVTGSQCLLTAHELRPDLILIDVALTDISGVDLAKRIKRDPDLAGVYVGRLR